MTVEPFTAIALIKADSGLSENSAVQSRCASSSHWMVTVCPVAVTVTGPGRTPDESNGTATGACSLGKPVPIRSIDGLLQPPKGSSTRAAGGLVSWAYTAHGNMNVESATAHTQ